MTPLEDVIQKSTRLRPNSKKSYLTCVRDFLAFVWPKCPESDLHPVALREWVAAARTQVEPWRDDMVAKNLDPTTINTKLAALRYATKRWAELVGEPYFNFGVVAEMVSLAGKDAKDRHALELDDVRRILAPCQKAADSGDLAGIRDVALITLAVYTGLRREALATLTCGALGNDKGQTWRLTVELKGGKMHTLPPLDPRAVAPLEAWIDCMHSEGCAVKGLSRVFRRIKRDLSSDGRHGALIGTQLSGGGVYNIVQRRAAAVGLVVHPHLFRHTFITEMERAGLGHLTAAYTGHRGGGRDGGGGAPPIQETYVDRVAMATREGTSALPDLTGGKP